MSKPSDIPPELIDSRDSGSSDSLYRAVTSEQLLTKSYSFTSLTTSLDALPKAAPQTSPSAPRHASPFGQNVIPASVSCSDMTRLNATHFVTERNQSAAMTHCRESLSSLDFLKNLKMSFSEGAIYLDVVGDFAECGLSISLYPAGNGSTIVDVHREMGDSAIFSSIYGYLYSSFFPTSELSSVKDFVSYTRNLSISKRRIASRYLGMLTKSDLSAPGVVEAVERLKRSTDPYIQENLTHCLLLS